MGIQGLLPLLKSIHKPTHLKNFSGQTLGVDAYGWLHRGTVSCAIELAEGKPTRKHIDFTLHRVRMLIHFGVKPYLVFDGDYLPSKAHTEKERATRRKESKRVGLELLRMGRSSAAQLELQKAVDVTPVMARELIEELKRMDVPYVVAPYEADSQLAYLEKQGIIDGVISEDSDLLVFGVNCLLTKLDQYGECVMINSKDFTACRDVSLVGWTLKEFRMMAMLNGCDYLPGIDKMGLKTAYRLVRKHKSIERVVRTVQFDGKMKIPAGYLDAFQNAERTFLYQWVFCPESLSLLNLSTLPAGLDAATMPYIGKYVESEVAAGVASGDLDPNTKRPIPCPPQRFQHPASRSRVVQTPDEKKGKPITEFFKKRVPLAELDPNMFHPSPSQEQIMQSRLNTSWSASQAPEPRLFSQARRTNIAGPSSAPQASRRVATDSILSRRLAPPKRQRLSSEPSIAAAMLAQGDSPGTTSPFFAKPTPQASPSLRKTSSRSKAEDFELWSDDSIVDGVVAAAAVVESSQKASTSTPRKRKKLSVFTDQASKEEDASIGDITQDSILSVASTVSQDASALNTPDTSFEEIDSPKEHSAISSRGISSNFASFRYGSADLQKSTPRTKSTPLFASTPLQFSKLAEPAACAQDLKEIASEDKQVEVPSSSPAPQIAFASDLAEPDNDVIDDAEWLAMEQRPISQQPKAPAKGSEDFLVPESPETTDSDGNARPTLSLSKFAFAG